MPAVENSDMRSIELVGGAGEEVAIPSAHIDQLMRSVVDGVSSAKVAKKLAERGVFLSHGDFYAMTVVERLGQTPHGLVRAGCACYTTPEEIDRLLAGVRGL